MVVVVRGMIGHGASKLLSIGHRIALLPVHALIEALFGLKAVGAGESIVVVRQIGNNDRIRSADEGALVRCVLPAHLQWSETLIRCASAHPQPASVACCILRILIRAARVIRQSVP